MWTLLDDSALLKGQSLSARLPLDSPSSGLVEISFQGRSLDWKKWLGVAGDQDAELILQHRYVRGTSLVCCYAWKNDRGTSVESSWSVLQMETESVGIELLTSVQDNPPDETPVVLVGTTVQVEECLLLDADSQCWSCFDRAEGPRALEAPSGILCRQQGGKQSYLEMLHPTDFAAGELRAGKDQPAEVSWTYQLSHDQLEKGVIRRSRLQGWIIPREDDQQQAEVLVRRFRDTACPLGK